MKIHFIGIGGIGVSALAKYYLEKGEQVSGSDLCASQITDDLIEKGVKVIIGINDAKNISDYDLVIYSPAVKEDNPERVEVKKRGIQEMSYPQALGEMTKNHYTIAVSGTHGKSTTTSMISLVLIEAGLDPTVVVGTKLKEFGNSNFRMGKSQYLIIEACEHEESFLNYWPTIGVITNVEEDHLDYYGSLENIVKAFNRFVSHLSEDGFLVKGEKVSMEHKNTEIFSLKDREDVEKIKSVIKIPGEHNILDALAALKVSRILEIDDEIFLKAISKFSGTWRRFDEMQFSNFVLIDDYAHHPTEILATLKGVREKYSSKKVLCIFQPHQYQRTYLLFDDFVKTFKSVLDEKLIDRLFLVDIYDVAGREDAEIRQKVSSEKLAKKIDRDNAKFVSNEKLFENIKDFDVVIFMGAGSIYNLSEEFKKLNGYCLG
ncbi:MAG: Mur ligase domain-containing protein [Candidatus Pacebacteria bacterium]|nr:Mur ligase domain-containing protein [Candidatus Paceibacterota bacterium]